MQDPIKKINRDIHINKNSKDSTIGRVFLAQVPQAQRGPSSRNSSKQTERYFTEQRLKVDAVGAVVGFEIGLRIVKRKDKFWNLKLNSDYLKLKGLFLQKRYVALGLNFIIAVITARPFWGGLVGATIGGFATNAVYNFVKQN